LINRAIWMRNLKNSIGKRLYSILVSPKKAQQEWCGEYWQTIDDVRDISCSYCRKFDKEKQQCRIPFGSPIRKCVISSVEAHLNNAKNKSVLEIGFGRFSLGKTLVKRSGGIWTGVEPHQSKDKPSKIGKGGYGHAADIPFPDKTFDMVFGVQTFEHWGQKVEGAAMRPSEYRDCIEEIWRVLKPGGTVYLDAPIHFHGHEMFIMGDLQKIRGLFTSDRWKDLNLERWRYHYEPLQRYVPYEKLFAEWHEEIDSYTEEEIERIKKEPIWMLALTVTKIDN